MTAENDKIIGVPSSTGEAFICFRLQLADWTHQGMSHEVAVQIMRLLDSADREEPQTFNIEDYRKNEGLPAA